MKRLLPTVLLLTALVATTAGCKRGGDAANAAPPAPSNSVDSGFGSGPRPTTPAPSPTTAKPTPTKTKPRPTIKPVVPQWSAVTKPCPYDGQKVEIQDVVHEDVTRDGVADTLVTHSCEATTSYWASTIEVFDGSANPAKPERIGTLLEDVSNRDQPVVEQVTFTKGTVGVKAHGTSAKGSRACPDLLLTYRYEWKGRAFLLTSRDAEQNPECPPGS